MKKVVTMLAMVVLMCSSAFALSGIGPLATELGQGNLSLGYNMGLAKLDVETDVGTIDNVDLDTHLGKLGYGVTDDLEIYGLYGIARIDVDRFDSSDDAFGFGVKFNLLKQGNLTIVAAYQMMWIEGDDDISIPGREVPRSLDVSVDVRTAALALGPQLQVTDELSIYGGGLAYMLDGEIKAGSVRADIDDDIRYGGFVGVGFAVTNNISISGEYQLLEDGRIIGAGVILRF